MEGLAKFPTVEWTHHPDKVASFWDFFTNLIFPAQYLIFCGCWECLVVAVTLLLRCKVVLSGRGGGGCFTIINSLYLTTGIGVNSLFLHQHHQWSTPRMSSLWYWSVFIDWSEFLGSVRSSRSHFVCLSVRHKVLSRSLNQHLSLAGLSKVSFSSLYYQHFKHTS